MIVFKLCTVLFSFTVMVYLIIKFGDNAHCHRLKERAPSDYVSCSSLHLLRAPAASCVRYHETKHSQGSLFFELGKLNVTETLIERC